MTNLRLYGSLAVCLSVFSAQGLQLDVRPGQLEAAMAGRSPETATELTLTGAVNAADLLYIATSMPALRTLDLADVDIAAYRGRDLAANCGDFPAATLPAYVMAGCAATTITLPASITSVGDGALMGAALKAVTIPASVTALGMGAFAGCPQLASATVPATVLECGQRVFANCPKLKSAVWDMTEIPDGAFAGCQSLTKVTPTAQLQRVGDEAFAGCSALSSFNFPAKLAYIGAGAFRSTALQAVNLSRCTSLSQMGDQAFAGCSYLTQVTMPAALTELPAGLFLGDESLTQLDKLPQGLTSLGALSLAGTALGSDFNVPQGVAEIGDWAMAGMTEAEDVTLHAAVASLGEGAMADMVGLRHIQASELAAVPALGPDVWQGVSQRNVTLEVSSGMEAPFKAADQWKEFDITQSIILELLDTSSQRGNLRASLHRGTVTATADSQITRLVVYDLSGRALAAADDCGARAELPVNAPDGAALVVVATLDDGSKSAVKIAE